MIYIRKYNIWNSVVPSILILRRITKIKTNLLSFHEKCKEDENDEKTEIIFSNLNRQVEDMSRFLRPKKHSDFKKNQILNKASMVLELILWSKILEFHDNVICDDLLTFPKHFKQNCFIKINTKANDANDFILYHQQQIL